MENDHITTEQMTEVALQVFAKRNPGYGNKTREREVEEICQWFIGTSYEVCSKLWNMIEPTINLSVHAQPKHFFWGFLLMKNYSTEPMNARIVGGVDIGTYRKWSWAFIEAISKLKKKVIKWENRFRNWNKQSLCLILVDCVDCARKEPWPFDKANYSEKFNGPAYKYEIGVSIFSGDVVWVNGPFPASTSNITIFKEKGLKAALYEDECVECDNVYQGDDKMKNPQIAQTKGERVQKSNIRGRGENVNGRLKMFRILDDVFRHSTEKHEWAFNAAAVITQLGFDFHGPMYHVEYDAEY